MEWSWNLAGSVILSGLVIVFLVLVILIVVVNITGNLTGSIKKTKPQPAAARTEMTAAPAPAPVNAPAPVVEAGISGETVAAISAAVAAVMDEQAPGVGYAVTNIQHSRAQRPVWGFAGMQQNTRPF